MTTERLRGLYGLPPAALTAGEAAGAIQFSPLIPGAADLAAQAPGSLAAMTLLAPAGVVERRYALACALRALAPGAPLLALAPKDRGGARLRAELEAFGCVVEETAKAHHRICATTRPQAPTGVEAAVEAGAPRLLPTLGLWSQPGVFSWDRIDPGSALLAKTLAGAPLKGRGADLGCGVGFLAQAALSHDKVEHLVLVDLDARAAGCAARNVTGPRAAILQRDVRSTEASPALQGLDFVVMNPPFHAGGREDHGLGQSFIRRAAAMLRAGGACWLVANRHLPYEAPLAEAFKSAELRAEAQGFKVYEARR